MPEGHGGAVTAQNAVNKRKKKASVWIAGIGKSCFSKEEAKGA
jgi:hypothetical protein